MNPFLKSLLIVTSIATTNVSTQKPVPIDESTMGLGLTCQSSEAEVGGFVTVMSNISYTCWAKFDCKSKSCAQLPELLWLLPRQLREHEMIYGPNTSRVLFSQQQRYYINGQNNYIIKSQMNITDVGAIHNGLYVLSHDMFGQSIVIDIPVRGRNKRGACNYDDQCISLNCYHSALGGVGVCKCDADQVYVPKIDQCFDGADYNETCSHEEQCGYNLGKDSAVCIKGRCDCSKGYTKVRLPLVGTRCQKIAGLNEKCEHTDQCRKSNARSFCSARGLCECNTGYELTGNDCKAYKTCNSSNFGNNVNFSRNGCEQNQFCRDSVCVCRPNYHFDGKDYCSPIHVGSDNNTQWYERYGYYIIGVLGVFLLVALIMIVIQLMKFRQIKRVETRSRENQFNRF